MDKRNLTRNNDQQAAGCGDVMPMLTSQLSQLQNLQQELSKHVATCQSSLDELNATLIASSENMRLKHSELIAWLQNEVKNNSHETAPPTSSDALPESLLKARLVVDSTAVSSENDNIHQSQHQLQSRDGSRLLGAWENLFAEVQKRGEIQTPSKSMIHVL